MAPIIIPVPLPMGGGYTASSDEDEKQARRNQHVVAVWWTVSLLVTVMVMCSLVFKFGIAHEAVVEGKMAAADGGAAVQTDKKGTLSSDQASMPSSSSSVCQSLPIFANPKQIRRRRGTKRPRLSIVFITKRPGGYDILLHSLALQSHPHDYELIVVDELVPHRGAGIDAMALELGVPLTATVPSKAKTRPNAHLRFGIYNALNTGLLMARGDIIAFVMDMTWLPDNFVARTLEFYDKPEHARSLLAYPEWFLHLKKESEMYPGSEHVWDHKSALTVFPKNFTHGFADKFEWFYPGQMRPEALVKDWICSERKDLCKELNIDTPGRGRGFEKQPVPEADGYTFWELSCATAPWSVIEEMNGLEEEFDYGDDCHESNIRIRAEMLGSDLWIDVATVVQNLWHKNTFQPGKELWNRFAEDNIMHDVLSKYPADIRTKKRPLRSQLEYNFSEWREHDCAAEMY